MELLYNGVSGRQYVAIEHVELGSILSGGGKVIAVTKLLFDPTSKLCINTKILYALQVVRVFQCSRKMYPESFLGSLLITHLMLHRM